MENEIKTDRMLILMNVFFNWELVERTLESIKKNNYDADIIFLENPSKYSDKMKEISTKYNIYKHLICNDNIEGMVFTLFILKNREFMKQYKYISLTESDAELDNGSIKEAVYILDKYNFGCCCVDIYFDYKKYHPVPIHLWEPHSVICEDYVIGNTGFQFLVFKHDFLMEFFDCCQRKELVSNICLGNDDYTDMSDTNLTLFHQRKGYIWTKTKYNKLFHTGWELYMNVPNEYTILKDENIKNKKIRNNLDITNCNFEDITKKN